MDFGAYFDRERKRIFDGASPERRAQLRRAERSREIYRVWNDVCGATREGNHVTGLHYLPDSNELLVYLDEPSWTQELTMLREIIRGRMARAGVELAGFVFKTSRGGYVRRAFTCGAAGRTSPYASSAARRGCEASSHDSFNACEAQDAPKSCEPITASQRAALDEALAPLKNEKLKEALKKAIQASLDRKKGRNGPDDPSAASGGLVEH